MQCHVLERFLSLVLATANVTMRYDTEFSHIDGDEASIEGQVGVVRQRYAHYVRSGHLYAADEQSMRVPFTLLVGADGGRSAVRRQMGAAFVPQERFSIAPFLGKDQTEKQTQQQHGLRVIGLNQTTLIMSFEQQGHDCPTLALHEDGACTDVFCLY